MHSKSLSAGSLCLISALAFSGRAYGQLPQGAPSMQNRMDLILPVSEDVRRAWADIGGRIVEMAQDFPESKYDFKVQKDQRTFAETLLHVAQDNLLTVSAIKGSHVGPEFNDQPPSRVVYHSKDDVVKLVKMSVDEGNAVIKDQSDAGLERAVLSPFSLDPVRVSTLWWSLIEDDGEHYGQLAVYYRANNLVPPRTRRQ